MKRPGAYRGAFGCLQVCRMGTPLGDLILNFTSEGLAALEFAGERRMPPSATAAPGAVVAMMAAVTRELDRYLRGIPTDFADLDPALALAGTQFQLRVWGELRRIPWGQTISYGELASRVGRPKGARAVGRANAANPLPIIVPCHRVIGADGSLGGYRPGLERKRWLLAHEGVRF